MDVVGAGGAAGASKLVLVIGGHDGKTLGPVGGRRESRLLGWRDLTLGQ